MLDVHAAAREAAAKARVKAAIVRRRAEAAEGAPRTRRSRAAAQCICTKS